MCPSRSQHPDQPADRSIYEALDQLDRLEELLEEMQDLGVRSIEDVERRIAELDALVGDEDPEEA
ncbi:MAG: hypothetical protein M3Q03_03885 [Chloroflexota bacterium]|nr:hypothetical protein [Chloroflexota bacterium]